MISVGDTVKLSHVALSFIKDFRGEQDYEDSKDAVMLVIDINDLEEITVLTSDGEIIKLEMSDVQIFSTSF